MSSCFAFALPCLCLFCWCSCLCLSLWRCLCFFCFFFFLCVGICVGPWSRFWSWSVGVDLILVCGYILFSSAPAAALLGSDAVERSSRNNSSRSIWPAHTAPRPLAAAGILQAADGFRADRTITPSIGYRSDITLDRSWQPRTQNRAPLAFRADIGRQLFSDRIR